MAEHILHTNPYVRTPKDRIERIAQSALASVRINQLPISEEEVHRMAANSVKRHPEAEGPENKNED